MKKILMFVLLVVVLASGKFAIADGQEVTRTEAPPTNSSYVLTNNITGIDVPLEVLEYVQFQYIGHAVTKAEKISLDGTDAYRLRVDRDDLLNDYESIILMYDMKWKLIGEAKLSPPPPPPPAPSPVVDKKEEKKETPEDKKPDNNGEEKPEGSDNVPSDSGGSGGDPPEADSDTTGNTEDPVTE